MKADSPRPPSVTRYFAIVAAFGVASFQATRDNWFEAAGLVGLATGLIMLMLAPRRPALRWVALGCFAVTLAAVIYVARRDYY